jgi:hypothetical protein
MVHRRKREDALPKTQMKLRDLDPTIIPAHSGYRIASVGTENDTKVTSSTKPEDLWIGYDPVIAWCVSPSLRDEYDVRLVNHVNVDPITPEGLMNASNTYLVHPDGKWSKLGSEEMADEAEARKHFIRENLSEAK